MDRAKLLTRILWAIAALGAVAALAATVVEANLSKKAVRAQRVRPSSEAALFGDIGETIGSPMLYVVDDPKAFLAHKGPGGLALIDETYLEKTGKYPLQLQTVNFVANAARTAGIAGAAVCAALAVLIGRKRPAPSATIPE
jgi:hypothetical protein